MVIRYSPDARDTLKEIRSNYGAKTAGKIVDTIKDLKSNPQKGPAVEQMIGVPNPYRFLHVAQNYVFYRVDGIYIYITAIYNERENFMWKIFGIRLRTDESIDYWGE